MFSPLKDKKNKKTIANSLSLIIDIESGLVRAALVVNAQGVPPRVMYTVSSPIIHRKQHLKFTSKDASSHGVTLLSSMAKALQDVTSNIANRALPKLRADGITMSVSKLHCALSSPWVISKTKSVKVNYDKDTEITKELIAKIVDTEHQELEAKFAAEQGMADGSAPMEYDLTFIEQKIFEIKLNGYSIQNVYGKKAREVEVSFAVTVSSKDIIDRIRDTIASTLNIVDIRGIYGVHGEYVNEYHSSLLLQYTAFRNLIKVRDDYIAAHVHNDLSDIIVVRRGVCSILASFPFGTGSFVTKTSDAMNQSEHVTHSALSMHSSQKLSADYGKEVVAVADPIISEWANQFFQTLALSGDLANLPRMLVLSVHDHFPFFERALKNKQQGISLNVTALDEAILEKAVTYERIQDTNALVSMYAFALDAAVHRDL